MNKFEAAVIRKYKTPANFFRELGLNPRLAMDEAPEEQKSAEQLVCHLIANLDPSELASVGECLRKLVGDSRGISRAAKDWLDGETARRDEGEDRRTSRDARPRRMGRDDLMPTRPEDQTDPFIADKRPMAHDQALPAMSFAAMFPNAAKIQWG